MFIWLTVLITDQWARNLIKSGNQMMICGFPLSDKTGSGSLQTAGDFHWLLFDLHNQIWPRSSLVFVVQLKFVSVTANLLLSCSTLFFLINIMIWRSSLNQFVLDKVSTFYILPLFVLYQQNDLMIIFTTCVSNEVGPLVLITKCALLHPLAPGAHTLPYSQNTNYKTQHTKWKYYNVRCFYLTSPPWFRIYKLLWTVSASVVLVLCGGSFFYSRPSSK